MPTTHSKISGEILKLMGGTDFIGGGVSKFYSGLSPNQF